MGAVTVALLMTLGGGARTEAQQHPDSAQAQPQGPPPAQPHPQMPPQAGVPPSADVQHAAMEHADMMPTGALGIPATRTGSGTSWLPDDTPMHALHRQTGAWTLMLHGNAFLQYLRDGGERGQDQLGSVNWAMGMAQRPLAGGVVELRAMLSAEPLGVGECGYPNLLASGESCDGAPIVDRQHPHDLFMELSASFQRALGEDLALQLYGGLAGEPALGPTAFPHRPSALPNVLAPVTHHWLDATHVAFGTVTAGLFGRRWKLEGSIFNGREPDENRWDLDLARLDSYAGRVFISPGEHLTLQISAGHLEEAEQKAPGEPRVDVRRVTASAIHHRSLGTLHWATTLAWGRNSEPSEEEVTNAFLAESSLAREADALFARLEVVQKTGEDLVISDFSHRVFTLKKVGIGLLRDLGSFAGIEPGLGAGLSLSFIPQDLKPYYGTGTALGFAVFGRIHMGQAGMAGGM